MCSNNNVFWLTPRLPLSADCLVTLTWITRWVPILENHGFRAMNDRLLVFNKDSELPLLLFDADISTTKKGQWLQQLARQKVISKNEQAELRDVFGAYFCNETTLFSHSQVVQLDCIEILAQLGLIYPINLGGLTPARLGLKSYNGVTFIRLPEPFRKVTSVAQIEGHPYYHIILAYLVGSTSLPESLVFKVGTETIAIEGLVEWCETVPFISKVPKRSLTAAAEAVMGKSCFFHGAIPVGQTAHYHPPGVHWARAVYEPGVPGGGGRLGTKRHGFRANPPGHLFEYQFHSYIEYSKPGYRIIDGVCYPMGVLPNNIDEATLYALESESETIYNSRGYKELYLTHYGEIFSCHLCNRLLRGHLSNKQTLLCLLSQEGRRVAKGEEKKTSVVVLEPKDFL